MMKQYGINPRLVIWIQRNTGHDLQTFSDLAKMKSLDSRRRNILSARKIEDIRLPSWLMVKENDFSLIGEMTKLKQLSLHDVAIDNYSFLAGCRYLSALDMQDTSFSDCRLLAELPALKKVLLPPYSQLKHTEVLERLSCIREIKEEKEEKPEAAEQPCGERFPDRGVYGSKTGRGTHPERRYHGFLYRYGWGLHPMAPVRLSGFQCGERVSGDNPAGGNA